ncbi:MAG: DUF4433 domain-containing protein [Bacteroidales bacterium]|nr:DUF4433 domain-containing protein [Bacteroidales bacterium]
MTDLSKRYLYRITHVENVPHILNHGVTHASSSNANKSYKSIGDCSIISTRHDKKLSNGKKLSDYIPFYFGARMPMLYVIQKGYNGVAITAANEIVYCVSSVQKIVEHNLPFLFSDGHAVSNLSSFYNIHDLDKIDAILDFAAVRDSNWKKENDLDYKRRKEAEFLVETDIPTTAIIGWIVYNDKVKERLLDMGIPEK